MARPSNYTPEMGDLICERLANGESLRTICDGNGMPRRATVFRWVSSFQEFRNQYTLAREAQAETMADDLIDIADNIGNPLLVEGVPLMVNGKPVMIKDAPAVNHARLRIDARKWIASKLKPKKYGELIRQEIGGADGGPVIVNVVRFSDDKPE